MKTKYYFMMVLTGLVVVPLQAYGQTVSGVIVSKRDWAATRASRRAQASEWLREVSSFAKQIPTLSPAEAAWLKVEYDDQLATNGLRAARARHSKEGSERFAKPTADEIVLILDQLASDAVLPFQKEVSLWSRLAYLTLDTNFWGDIESLGDFGVLTRDKKSALGTPGMPTYGQMLLSIWASRAQEILRAIVMPYVNSTG